MSNEMERILRDRNFYQGAAQVFRSGSEGFSAGTSKRRARTRRAGLAGLVVRRATEADLQAIGELRSGERVRPLGNRWRNFMVAECDGRLVGAIQLRIHADGSRELGSLIVERASRNLGVAGRLIDEMLSTETARVFAITSRDYSAHYGRWGFTPVRFGEAAFYVKLYFCLGTVAGWIFSRLQGRPRNRLAIIARPSRMPV
jgi:N-acetylglutamate synthase-like GNAT family acetyltransferase